MFFKFGLIGEHLKHSYSKELHTKIMKDMGISGSYGIIEIPSTNFHDAFSNILTQDYNGLNVTIPYKEAVIPYLDVISKSAKKIGAVNTISFKDNTSFGYNTDYDGFLQVFKSHSIDIKGKKAAILGYGGASKAVIAALNDNGAESILVVTRNIPDSTDRLPFHITNYGDFNIRRDSYDFIINCTPVGMYPNMKNSPIPKASIRSEYLFDLIYNPTETLLISHAIELGIKTFNGMEMLESQARKSQEIWAIDSK
ncbi:MAG: shikimate dehydrogenase [Eubacteriales bacterium]